MVRVALGILLLVVSVGLSVGTYMNYRDAHQALLTSRTQRKLTDFKLCRALNEVRKVNNRDRETFIRARAETRDTLTRTTDPFLRDLLRRSIIQNTRELRVRPHLNPVPCRQVILHPTGTLPVTTGD